MAKRKLSPIFFSSALTFFFPRSQAKINDRGIAALAYNIRVKPGFTFGLGASFDTQKLNEAGHKVCFLIV